MSNSYERNLRSSSDVQRHAINQQYVPQRSGSRRQSQTSQDAPPLDESMKKPLPLEPIQSGETPMEHPNGQPVYPEPVSRKPVPMESTPETTRSGQNFEKPFETNSAQDGSIPGVGSDGKHARPPPIEVSAEILQHVDTALPHLTSNVEGSSHSSSQDAKSLGNEQHYKLVNEDNFHATSQNVVAKDTAQGGTEFRAPEVTDFDAAKPHKEIYFDHEVHHRNAAVNEEIKPHVHTIYEPKRTRSIHYHEHRQVIQPISDPNPIVKPAAHWAEDHKTGEIFKIPDALGEQMLENAYAEFKRIDGCNAYGDEAAVAGKFQEMSLGDRGNASGESDIIAQNYVSSEGTTGHRIHNAGGLDGSSTQHQAGTFQGQSGNRSNIPSALDKSSTSGYGQHTQQRELGDRGNISRDFNKLNLNDQTQSRPAETTTAQPQSFQQQIDQQRVPGKTTSERSYNSQGRRPSLPPDPRQTSPPPAREFRIQRPSLFPDV